MIVQKKRNGIEDKQLPSKNCCIAKEMHSHSIRISLDIVRPAR